MTTLSAVVRIVDLPAATTITGAELFEVVQTTAGVGLSVQVPISQVMTTSLGGLPTGGATGQLLSKQSGTNFSAGWSSVVSFVSVNATTLATSGSVTSIVINIAAGGVGSTQLAALAVQQSNITSNAIGTAQLASSLGIASSLSVGTLLTVGGTATFNGGFVLNGSLGIIGSTLLTGSLGIVGTTLATGSFNVVGTSSFTGVYNVNGTALFTSGTFGVVGTSQFTGIFNVAGTANFTSSAFNVVGTTLFTAARFGVIGTAFFTGTFGVVGTTLVTGLVGIAGTTNITGVISAIGSASFSGGTFGVLATTNITGIVSVIGTANFSGGTFGVLATSAFTGITGIVGTTLITGTFGQVGTSLMTGLFGVVGTSIFTTNLFNVVGTSLLTGTIGLNGTTLVTGVLVLGNQTVGFLQTSATGVVTAAPNAGNFVLLNTLLPNNVASATDTTSLTSTYNSYLVLMSNLAPANTTGSLQVTVATSGANWISGGYVSVVVTTNASNLPTSISADSSTTVILVSGNRATTTVGNGTTYGANGSFRIFNPSSATFRKHVAGEVVFLNGTASNTSTISMSNFVGYQDLTTAITGINFNFAVGNIQTGTIKIYGIT